MSYGGRGGCSTKEQNRIPVRSTPHVLQRGQGIRSPGIVIHRSSRSEIIGRLPLLGALHFSGNNDLQYGSADAGAMPFAFGTTLLR
jgi:hypothetical protein